MLWRIVRSTTGLLTSEDLQRVGVCADDRGCGWLFYDTSRNRTRQWCSMRGCGNRAKAKRHYDKVKGEE
jgi:predicted RNA-binding Zn ribbon-like protein